MFTLLTTAYQVLSTSFENMKEFEIVQTKGEMLMKFLIEFTDSFLHFRKDHSTAACNVTHCCKPRKFISFNHVRFSEFRVPRGAFIDCCACCTQQRWRRNKMVKYQRD